MKFLFTFIFLIFLSGCSTLAPGIQRAADAYDDSLGAAELWQCRGTSVASAFRRYASSPELWDAWLTICGYKGVDVSQPVLQP